MGTAKDKTTPVNLTLDGRVCTLEAKLDKPVETPLFFFVEPVGGNNTPLKYVAAKNRAGFGPNSAPQAKGITDGDKLTVEGSLAFQVSVCGLDKFKVFASTSRDGADKKYAPETHEVWRKLYYSYRTMKPEYVGAAPGVDFTVINGEYNKYGIELEEITSVPRKIITYRELLIDTQTFFFKSGVVPSFSIDAHPVTKGKQEARLFFVDQVCKAKAETQADVIGDGKSTLEVWTTNLDQRLKGNNKLVWPFEDYISGNVGHVKIADLDKLGAVTRDGNLVTIDLNKHPDLAAKVKAKEKMRWEITLRFIDGALNGFAYEKYGIILIAARTRTPSAPDSKTGKCTTVIDVRAQKPKHSTVVHEMGHGLKLTHPKFSVFKEDSGADNGQQDHPFYFDIGSGGHCGIGSAWKRESWWSHIKDFFSWAWGSIFGGYNGKQLPMDKTDEPIKSGTCVMFYQGWPERPLTFCEHCAPLVRAADMGLGPDGMYWPKTGYRTAGTL